ncbi:hypothetical protein PLICRDRAFT_448878 [Plicaturopsis crispa FD-325 SS-3]|uniref:Uncharacterized protein n=1 Tax=Plicaturopsis crispa FD-325 SS-3 TaxID=944288 RepID=A0A0C9T350_PLICR|nr:hypothetical protein PLICRDRAFT_448878 [Plicaturopsis crispa FD-325 SS-3]
MAFAATLLHCYSLWNPGRLETGPCNMSDPTFMFLHQALLCPRQSYANVHMLLYASNESYVQISVPSPPTPDIRLPDIGLSRHVYLPISYPTADNPNPSSVLVYWITGLPPRRFSCFRLDLSLVLLMYMPVALLKTSFICPTLHRQSPKTRTWVILAPRTCTRECGKKSCESELGKRGEPADAPC